MSPDHISDLVVLGAVVVLFIVVWLWTGRGPRRPKL